MISARPCTIALPAARIVGYLPHVLLDLPSRQKEMPLGVVRNIVDLKTSSCLLHIPRRVVEKKASSRGDLRA